MQLPPLIQSLLQPACYPHPVAQIELIETHISWLILTGEFAYKIKKPVKLDFLDFSQLSQRQYYCQQELQLNRRYSPELYLAVVTITGDLLLPQLDGEGEPLEYAVKLRQFDRHRQLDLWCVNHQIDSAYWDTLADDLSQLHQQATRVSTAVSPTQFIQENLSQLAALLPASCRAEYQQIKVWTQQQLQQDQACYQARLQQGMVRQLHGDLHLANLVLLPEGIRLFDCIEFNPDFSNIDVLSDLAFLLMDLMVKQQSAIAWRILDRYLQTTGDYPGLVLLRGYLVYRALIRAKVALLAQQPYQTYWQFVLQLIQPQNPSLWVCCGVAGSGKSYHSQRLLQQHGLIRLRSDVERKRLVGLAATQRSQGEIYTWDLTVTTYARMAELSQLLLQAGWSVIIDATCLTVAQREQFLSNARSRAFASHIVFCQADPAELKRRIEARMLCKDETSEAGPDVMARQLTQFEPFTATELPLVLVID